MKITSRLYCTRCTWSHTFLLKHYDLFVFGCGILGCTCLGLAFSHFIMFQQNDKFWENWCWKTAIIADGKGSYFETTRILLTAVKCTQLHLKRAKGWLCTAIPVLQHNKWGKTVSPQDISLRVLKHEGQQRVIKEVSGLNGDWSIKLPYFGNSREFCARDCSISPKRHQICRWSGGGTTTPGSSPSL